LPFLLSDDSDSDGWRQRRWLVADTVMFRPDGTLRYARVDRWVEQVPGQPDDAFDAWQQGGGYFEQLEDRVAIAWNYISAPPRSGFTDALRVIPEGLSRKLRMPPSCFTCPAGPLVDALYTRR
jgi:hypothetical protein